VTFQADTSSGNVRIIQFNAGDITLVLFPDILPAFRDLVQRAMNTWPDAPTELKEFADLLLDGKILQDYKSQG